VNPSGTIAVIGGGPAGAMCAAGLAEAGRRVVLFDEKLAWEKPCGGGLTDKALRQYPFLRALEFRHNRVTECELTSPRGRTLLLQLDREVAIFSRLDLNALLLERARAAGVEIRRQRVTPTDPALLGADALVLAAGARNLLRPSAPRAQDALQWMATAGYYLPLAGLPWPRQRMAIRFLPALDGYIWSFPRADHASVGICGPLGRPPTRELRSRLEAWLDGLGIAWRGARFYSHLLPCTAPGALRTACYEGRDPVPWAIIGDAAHLVDPITGEGLYYALRSGELLAQAWSSPGPSYTARVQRELIPELEAAAALARRFYGGRFLGDSILERMALFASRSRRFRQLLCDLFAGSQGYLDLRTRLYRQLAPTLWEMATHP